MFGIAVVIDEDLRPRQAAAVDDRRVVQRVREDDVAGPGQRSDHPEVGEVSRAEQHRRLPPLERGQALLEAMVGGHRP
jgi:hypothetical protein